MILKDAIDRTAEAELEKDAAEVEHREALRELESVKTGFPRYVPYFSRKWEHERKVLEEVDQINAVHERLASVVERSGAAMPDTHLSLEDFDMPGLDDPMCGSLRNSS